VAVHLDRPADDAAIGVEPARPQSVAQDHFVIPIRLVFFGKNISAEHRGHAERGEHVGGHSQSIERFGQGTAIAGQIEERVAIDPHRCETAVALQNILRVTEGHPIGVGFSGLS
jgi:hypothetical protein